MAALTAEDIDKYEAQFGEVAHCKGPQVEAKKDKDGNVLEPARPRWEIVLKKPEGRKYYKIFRAMANDKKQQSEANEFIIRNGKMLVYPPIDQLDALLERHYGICDSSAVQKAVIHLLDLESDETGKV
jgi:hypothetical protein